MKLLSAYIFALFLASVSAAFADDWKTCMDDRLSERWDGACGRVLQQQGIPDERRALAESQQVLGQIQHGDLPCLDQQAKLLAISERMPRNPKLLFNYALSFQTCVDYKKAAQLFDQVLLIEPKFPRARYWKANSLSNAGLNDEAVAEYAAALKASPRDSETYWELGMTYMDMKKYPEAVAAYSAALKHVGNLDPYIDMSGAVLKDRAKAYFAMGNNKAAVADYNKLKKLKPEIKPEDIAPDFAAALN